ncbi:methyltransferase domain-containing protein [Candidatus Electronema sp. TJ]|uniref:methyltransferase domain-containing protein n=1 Tax=Candidatus Electronema sp. TJ TaxID=3401573 RepID=UPI003AA83689
MNCRHCGTPLTRTFLDLGTAPPSNAYLSKNDLNRPELHYPLKVMICNRCWLAQTVDYTQADELFRSDYAYFSSTSTSWLRHAEQYAQDMISRLNLGRDNLVIEIACNDGYLLKNFVAAEIPCLGIEPTASTASAAKQLGIPVLCEFFSEQFGKRLAAQGRQADLLIGNNVYAHVPDINDFTRGLKAVLRPGGTITLEFPHLLRLLEQTQFDTVYHEHFSYFSLNTVSRIFQAAGLRIWEVEQLATHGGSLRVFGCHDDDPCEVAPAVADLLAEEIRRGLQTVEVYENFQARADAAKDDLLTFLIAQKKAGKKVAGYGAAAKGNTLLNYAGIKPDLLPFVSDAAPSKQGKFLPGSRIPILAPFALAEYNPDVVLILPWNLAQEIRGQLAGLPERGTRFVTAVPRLEIA